jgi:N-acylglucosamine 2-epimerase
MNQQHLEKLHAIYRDGLLEDTLPFWLDHCVDREDGGFMMALDQDGTVVDTDKGMWQQCRFTWLLSTLYNTLEPRDEWLDLARHGIDFIRRYGTDDDGRMFFQVTKKGAPLRKRRYVFTESFGAIAHAAYAKASGDEQSAEEAVRLYNVFLDHLLKPELSVPKIDANTRPTRGLGPYMVLINMSQVLRDTLEYEKANEQIDCAIDTIKKYFMNEEHKALMEVVGPNGELIDHFDGRTLNPGHAIESAWFIMEEARRRGNDPALLKLGTTILDWMWEHGWDKEHGGLLYFVDVKGGPVQEYWHDMKFWWNHNETIIATLLAHLMTGEKKYADWHTQVHEWAYTHFPDREHGEWFGYLHRNGTRSSTLKGNLWKGPFHLPRMQLYCSQLIESELP